MIFTGEITMTRSDAGYDSSKGPQREALADAISIRKTLNDEGSDAAVNRMRTEINSVPERERAAYNSALLKNLQGDGRASNILPEMSVAFGMQNPNEILRDSKKPWVTEKIVDPEKIRSATSRETNPVYQELYRQFGAKYQAIRAENGWNPYIWQNKSQMFTLGGVNVFESQLHGHQQVDKMQAENRKSLGLLATHPKLFNDIASGGDITMEKVERFQENWSQPGAAGVEFRKRYGSTQEAQNRVGSTVEQLRMAFDDDRNKDNKPGAVLKDNVAGVIPRRTGIEWFNSYGRMTRESLLDGLGYRSIDEAKARTTLTDVRPADAKQAQSGKRVSAEKRTDNMSSSSRPDQTAAIDNESSKVIRNQGPYAVAKNMLAGSDLDNTALRDLTKVLLKDIGVDWKSIRVGTPVINLEGEGNLELVRSKVQATNNTKLIAWFDKKYPH